MNITLKKVASTFFFLRNLEGLAPLQRNIIELKASTLFVWTILLVSYILLEDSTYICTCTHWKVYYTLYIYIYTSTS